MNCNGWEADYAAGLRGGCNEAPLKILLRPGGERAWLALGVFVLLEAYAKGSAPTRGRRWLFPLSSLSSNDRDGRLCRVAIVIYVDLSRIRK